MAEVELVRAFKDGNIIVALGELQGGDTFAVKGDGTHGGALAMRDPTNTFTTMLTGGAITSDQRLTLPTTGGYPGQIIYTDGNGNWDYTDSISLTDLTVPNIQVAVTDTQTIDTTSGNLVLNSATGQVTVGNNLVVTGALTVMGTTTTVNSTTMTVDDPVFTLGGDTAPAADDNKDRGIEFRWHDGSSAKLGFFGWDDSDGVFTFRSDANNTGEVFSGALGNVAFGAGTFTGHVIPSADITYNLGSPTNRWDALYVQTLASDAASFKNVQVAVTDDQTVDTITGNLTLNANSGTVSIESTNTNVTGILNVTGASNLTGTVTTTNDVSIGTTLAVTSTSTLTGDVSMIANATVGGTLGVTGATTLSDTLGVTGATTLSSTLGVTGATTLSDTLGVTGATTLSSTLGVTGDTNLNANTTIGNANTDKLTVTAQVASDFIPDTDITHDLGSASLRWNTVHAQTIAADSTTFGDIQIALTASNEIDTSANDLVLDSATGETTIDDNATVTGTFDSTGDATFAANVIVNGLTPTRVVYVGASDELVDSANMTFDGTTLTTTAINVDNITIDGSSISSTAAALTLSPNVVISGNLTVTGTTTTVQSTTVNVADPVFTLGGDGPPAADDNKDRGIEFNWHNGTAAKVGFFGWDDSASVFTFIPEATNTSEVFSGTAGNVAFGTGNFAGTVTATGFSGPLTGNADTATALQTARTITIGGDAAGSVSFDGTADVTISIEVAQADAWETARTITLAGDATGSVSLDGTADQTLTVSVTGADTWNTARTLTIDGDAAGSVSLDGSADATLTLEVAEADKWETARTITLAGDLTGNVSIDGSADVTLTAAVVDDSHSHDTQYYTETEVDTFLAGKADLNGSATETFAASSVSIGADWTVTQTGTAIVFSYQGTGVFKVESNGAVTAADDVVAMGTV